MNIAIIFAGGVGRRMNSGGTPKQFLELHGKPIIIHTLDVFENCPEIDSICIACHPDYLTYMEKLCEKFLISKVKWIVPGGETSQQSQFHALKVVHSHCPEDSVVLIHDGVRPNISADLIRANIQGVLEHGSAISCAKATETPAEIDETGKIVAVSPRENAVIAKAPQSFFLRDIYNAHLQALEENRGDFIDSASMLRHYGKELYSVPCRWDNIKITNPSDFYIFRAILEARENSQIFGL